MFEWKDDLKLSGCDLWLDSRKSRPTCYISHAHSDHLGEHATAICTPETAALAERRVGLKDILRLPYHASHFIDTSTSIELLPAGHVLGSAMLYARREGQSVLYTGDYKLRPCLTVRPAELVPADVLVMESTYGLPFFRFPPREEVAARLVELVEQAFRDGRQPIVLGYALGKAQEIVRILTDGGHAVTAHGAVWHVNQTYEALGVPLGAYRKYRYEDFHGEAALDLRERGVLVAPPNVARSGFSTRFKNPVRIVMTGWALQKNAVYRYGVEHALPLSDHADFDELIETVERVRPRKVFTHHGYREFADTLRRMGFDARCARPDDQLTLFPE